MCWVRRAGQGHQALCFPFDRDPSTPTPQQDAAVLTKIKELVDPAAKAIDAGSGVGTEDRPILFN
jgi:hypothetical protein